MIKYCVIFLLTAVVFACGGTNTKSDTVVTQNSQADTLKFEVLVLRDSAKLVEEVEESAMLNYDIATLVPQNGTAELQQMINDELLQLHGYDGRPIANGDYAAAYRSLIDSAIIRYRSYDVDEDFSPASHVYIETYDFTNKVAYNKPGLLTLESGFYTYTGGAHGMYGTSYLSFLTNEPPKSLELEDVLTSTDSTILGALLFEHLEDKERLYTEDQPIPPTNNFGVVAEGIVFCYPPYEIGPYAAGQIEIVVPYATLKERGLLRKEIDELLTES